jgi:hypothetical protein
MRCNSLLSQGLPTRQNSRENPLDDFILSDGPGQQCIFESPSAQKGLNNKATCHARYAHCMARTIIHVNQHVVRRNKKHGTTDPVLTVKRGRTNTYAATAEVRGPCRVVYSPDKPLSCGARVWIETDAEVVLTGVSAAPRCQPPE